MLLTSAARNSLQRKLLPSRRPSAWCRPAPLAPHSREASGDGTTHPLPTTFTRATARPGRCPASLRAEHRRLRPPGGARPSDLRRPVPQVPAADVLSEDDRHPARPCRTLTAAATRTIRSRAGSARGPVARSGLESPSGLETALNDRVQRGGSPGRPASGASGDATAFMLGAPRRRPFHPDRRATPRIPEQHLSEVARHAVETRRRSKSVPSVHGRHDKAELACPNSPPGLLLLSV